MTMLLTRSLSTTFLAGLLTLPPMCNVRKTDAAKMCNAESLSRTTLRENKTQVFTWMERNVASSEAIILVKNLESKDARAISMELREQARLEGLPGCALAEQADTLAKDEDFRTDLADLCTGTAPRSDGSVARLDVSADGDAERIREVVDWTTTNAKSPGMQAVVAQLVAAAPKSRGALLRDEASKVGLASCALAVTLDTAPPSVTVTDTHQTNPNFTLLKVDGPLKNQSLIGFGVTAADIAAAINTCYAPFLLVTPTLSGKVAVKLTFDAMGRVATATDDGSLLKSPVQCIATSMLSINLGGPLPDGGKKGAKATVTMQLTPSTSGPGYAATIDPTWLAKAHPAKKR